MGNQSYCLERLPASFKPQNLITIKPAEYDLKQLDKYLEEGNKSYQNSDYSSALKLYYQALEGYKVICDKQDKAISRVLNNIAMVYKQQEDYENAQQVYQQALWIQTGKQLEDIISSKDTFTSEIALIINNIGSIQIKQKNNDEAITSFKVAYQILKKQIPRQPAKMMGILNNLGLAYLDLQQYEKSYKYFKSCVEKNTTSFSEISVQMTEFDLQENEYLQTDVYNNLGIVAGNLGRLDEAIECFEIAVQMCQQDEDQILIAKIMNNMVGVFQQQNDLDSAFDCCQKSLELRLQHLGQNNCETLQSYQNLALLYQQTEQYEDALQQFLLMKNIQADYFPENDQEIAQINSQIAVVYQLQKKYQLAIDFQKQAVNIRYKYIITNQQQCLELGESLFNIGFNYNNLKKYEKSIKFFNKSVNVLQQFEDKNIQHIINIIMKESQAYKKLKDIENYKRTLENALMFLENGESDEIKDQILKQIQNIDLDSFDKSQTQENSINYSNQYQDENEQNYESQNIEI